jgi:HK97 family phage prohead protease
MPYFVTGEGEAEGCPGYAVVKEDGEVIGCHTTQQDAIDQMVAISIAEDMEPGGSYRELPSNYRPALADDVPDGRACGNCVFYDETQIQEDLAWCSRWEAFVSGAYYCNAWQGEERQADTPAPEADQISGSDVNEPGSAGGPGGDIELSEATETALRNKISEHNDQMAEDDRPDWTRATFGMLAAVYRRGAGAYSTSHRPGQTRGAWAMARVNSFLFLLRTGSPENPNYVTDNDLLPEDHPKSTRTAKRNIDGEPAIIVDIDGTLITAGRPNLELIDYLDSQDAEIFIVTARPESERSETLDQLESFDIDFDFLFMKDSDEETPAWKKSVAETILETYNVLLAIDNDPDNMEVFQELGIPTLDPEEIRGLEIRQQTPPEYIQAAAARGLELRAEGFGGDGLTDRTIREARLMADGEMSDDKVIRANAWAARHAVDLEAPSNSDPDDDGWPGAGAVAHYLWGIDPLDPEPARAWLERTAEMIRGERNIMSNVEIRTFEATVCEVRSEGDGMTFAGYAWRYNEPSLPLPFTERIAPGAFTRTLKSKNDIRAYVNHDDTMLLGSTRAKTLRIEDRAEGGYVEIDLPDTTAGRDIRALVSRGDITGMSFGFSTVKDSWSSDGGERTLLEVRLHEVSVVTAVPAYPQTTASVRNLRVIAKRTETDPTDLADAISALEAGELNEDQAGILRKVVDRAAGVDEPVAKIPVSLLMKQIDLLAKAI